MSEKRINKKVLKRYHKSNAAEEILVKLIKKYIDKKDKKSGTPKG